MARKPTASLPDVFAKPGQAPARGTPIEALPRNGAPAEGWAAPNLPRLLGTGDVRAVTSSPSPVQAEPAPNPATAGSTTSNPQPAEPTTTSEARLASGSKAEPEREVGENVAAADVEEAMLAPGPSLGAPTADATNVLPEATPGTIPAPQSVSAAPPPPAEPVTASNPPAPAPPVSDTRAPDPPARGAAWRIAIAALCVSLTTPLWYDNVLRGLGLTTALDRQQLADTVAISAQERRLRDVEQRLSATTGQLSRAQADLARAERQQRDATEWTRRMLLLRLTETLRHGVPFSAELAIIRSSGAGEVAPQLDQIAPYAPIGVPTLGDLERDFRRLTDPILRPYRALNPMAWLRAAWGLIPYAPLADRDPGREQLRETAEFLRAGDPQGAARHLRSANAAMTEMMAGWLADADARVAADALIRRVETPTGPRRP
jgi:hypothetical protein